MTPTLLRTDCIAHLQSLPDASVDAIVTDPPYMYLDHRLDRPFDVEAYAREVARVLRPRGLCVHFGRGPMLWALHTALQAEGMVFKEEIVWDKAYSASPTHTISRRHELAVVMGRKASALRRGVRLAPTDTARNVPQEKQPDLLRRLQMLLGGKHPDKMRRLREFLNANPGQPERITITSYEPGYKPTNPLVQGGGVREKSRDMNFAQVVFYGYKLPSILRMPAPHSRAVRIHPTEKPVQLLRYLIRLVSDPGDTILDPFAGSASCGEAALREGRAYVGCEIDPEYHAAASQRLERIAAELASGENM